MAADKTIVLITGGNSGIGLEVAAQLLADKTKHVILGSRSLEKGEKAVKDLKSRNLPGSVELLQLDITDPQSIEAAVKTVENSLINNAAIASPTEGTPNAVLNNYMMASPEDPMPLQPLADYTAMCFQANATGPLLMGEAFSPLLRKSTGTPRIISVSSGAGSIASRIKPNGPGAAIRAPWYRASKAAMNMVTACQVADYGGSGFKVFAYCPGYTVSNLSAMNSAENGAKPTSQGARPIVRMVNGECDEWHGRFAHENGDDELGEYGW
ncbi:hypothetical protein KC318_g10172 [Hortaea werneckii]|uniref:NAD(P)-binding protein n=1 Tax=Hortaea werneckii TaxID=91943 RepID=A0A3M6Y933_HORWE|nr:hypothetical protein KC334_g6015 [Hortaea werneckii]KAI7013775.1 hypothetical protein KC355_g4916 [Hortaea werneckii]KAI7660302.1 hypothetical protein KC318_g10172 [Hortaea werneckii]RMX99569.1 hypothetical protein D0867_12055 [Hortaea werneckii]